MVDTERLEELVTESGKKKSFLAESLGITVQSLRRKFDNKADFKTSEVQTLCQQLGITSLEEKEKIFFLM